MSKSKLVLQQVPFGIYAVQGVRIPLSPQTIRGRGQPFARGLFSAYFFWVVVLRPAGKCSALLGC